MAALAEITVIEGNLGDAAPFTIRLKLPAGYDVLPHAVLGARPRVAFALPPLSRATRMRVLWVRVQSGQLVAATSPVALLRLERCPPR